MLTDLGLSTLLLLLFILGLTRPHVAVCAVVFVDLFVPQQVSVNFLNGKPIALIAAGVLALSLVIGIRRCAYPVKFGPTFVMGLLMVWITITTYQSQFPFAAWHKYDFVIKSLVVIMVFPFVLHSRNSVESFILAILGAASYFLVIGGARTALGQGGYGNLLVVTGLGNSLIAETSTLSMVGVIALSLLNYIARYSRLAQRNPRFIPALCAGLAFCSVLTVLGTHARTGMIGGFVLFVLVFMRAKIAAKIRIITVSILIGSTAVMVGVVDDSWITRMNTVSEVEEEGSALGRIIVWKWTLDYVKERPIMGGGFMAYRANAGQLAEFNHTDTAVDYKNQGGKAFHSIYFEVLGEHGYVGLALYLYLMYMVWSLCRQIEKSHPESWAARLAVALRHSLLVYAACGSFIGISFMQWLFYLLCAAVGLHNAMHHSKTQALQVTTNEKAKSW